MRLVAGERWRSSVSEAQVVVVRGAETEVELTCGDAPMLGLADTVPQNVSGSLDGPDVLLGKRYVDAETGVELLCTKTGTGALGIDGRALELKQSKALPSSD